MDLNWVFLTWNQENSVKDGEKLGCWYGYQESFQDAL